ncbi:hypothetical protein [Salinarimonas soli]|uniref:Uncharacterized protein n=1 Tax=Salinarimonas soli TaxID=1638099 RepID=A0A5B2VVD9_9HYPH|nr:hypothetical protein [Salinarimonas soli]KAA2242227.1 hypothetical protein F0L46_02755 [Salinarimonas soli]
MLTFRLNESEATTIMVALRELQERMESLPADIQDLTEGNLLDELGIDDLCHRMRGVLAGEPEASIAA